MKMHRFLALGAIAVVLALFAACGGDEDPIPTPRPAAQPTPTPTAEAMMEEKPTPTAEAMMEEKPTPTPEAMTEQPTPTAAPRPTPTPVPPPPGFDAEEYFGGKTIRIITGTSPGGGYDTFSRIVAATAERYFPESTRFIVQNLPGAGQLRGLRAVLNSSRTATPSAPSTRAGSHGRCSWATSTGSTSTRSTSSARPTFTIAEEGFCLDKNFASSWQEVLDRDLTIRVGSVGPGNEPPLSS